MASDYIISCVFHVSKNLEKIFKHCLRHPNSCILDGSNQSPTLLIKALRISFEIKEHIKAAITCEFYSIVDYI